MRIAPIVALILPLAGCGGVSYPTSEAGADQGGHDMGLVDRGPDGPLADSWPHGDFAKKDSWTPYDGPAIWPDQAPPDDGGGPYPDAAPYPDDSGPPWPDAPWYPDAAPPTD